MNYVDDLDTAQFSSAEACRAAGIEQATLKNWLSRDPPIMAGSDRQVIGGRTLFLFSLRRVCALAIVAELVRGGIAPKQAVAWALRFTESSGTAKGPHGLVRRLPGQLFADLHTYLIATVDAHRVVGVDPLDPIALAEAIGQGGYVLELGHVINRVRDTLGLEPFGPLHAKVPTAEPTKQKA